jgi:hypothetical protein
MPGCLLAARRAAGRWLASQLQPAVPADGSRGAHRSDERLILEFHFTNLSIFNTLHRRTRKKRWVSLLQ